MLHGQCRFLSQALRHAFNGEMVCAGGQCHEVYSG